MTPKNPKIPAIPGGTPDGLPYGGGDQRKNAPSGRPAGPCETCLFYDVLDESGAEGCTVDADEDEVFRERADPRPSRSCPYYRYYDEYKLVQKQN